MIQCNLSLKFKGLPETEDTNMMFASFTMSHRRSRGVAFLATKNRNV